MRNLIKNILKESFLIEKAARRKRPTEPKELEKKLPTSTGKWIYDLWTGEDGKVRIIWQDDVDKINDLNAEITDLERRNSNLRDIIKDAHRNRRYVRHAGHTMMRAHQDILRNEKRIEDIKLELESLTIDKPFVNYFDI